MDPLKLLERTVWIADLALGADDRISTQPETLRDLREQVLDELARFREAPIIDEKAEMLLRALQNAALYDADHERGKADEWRWIARALLPFVRTQLAQAQAKEARR